MTFVARAVTALALLAFATPALPCGDKMKTTMASASEEKASTSTVAKASSEEKQKKGAQAKAKAEQKPVTASN